MVLSEVEVVYFEFVASRGEVIDDDDFLAVA
jgi:hypothetical protein